MEALAIGSAPPRPPGLALPPLTRHHHLLLHRSKTLAPRRFVAAAPMDAAAAAAGRGGPAPPRCARAETDSEDAVATTSSPHSAEAAGAAEQGNGAPAPVADAADVEGVDGIRIRRRPVTGPPVHYVGPFQFRLENEGNTPRNILERIVWDKEAEMKERRPLYMLKGPLENAPPVRDFVGVLKASFDRTGLPALIAEVKKASPSRGVLREDFEPVQIAQTYEKNGAACLSVLTDAKYFQGSFDYLDAIRNAGVQCPLLCKEFIVDAWQLYYARLKGADAVLLIAAVLPDLDIKYMLKICKILGMAALVEVHDEREMDRVLGIDGVQLIGINNRNLETFQVDISNTKNLLEGERGQTIAQKGIIVVGESGLFTPDHISFVQNAGVKAVLVGESLIKQEDPGKAIAGLFGKDISPVSAATQEEEALQKLYTLHNNETSAYPNTSEEEEDAPLKSAADVLFTERMKIKFNEWRNSIVSNQRVDDHRSENFKFADQFQTVFFKMRPAIMLNGFTSHQLKLIRQILRTHFRDLVYVCTFLEDGVSEKRVVYTDTNEDKISLMKNVREDLLKSREAKVKSAVGIRHVIDLLASERKLIVGHSCFLDIAQIYSKFVGPLPSSMEEFALSINRMFPHMADTRHLMSVNDAVQYRMRHKSKSLSSAFSLLCPALHAPDEKSSTLPSVRIEVEADETVLSCFTSGAKHEAGYDAFMTGCVFVQLCAYHGIKFEQLSPLEDLATNINLKKHINLLPPCWNSGTVLDLSTGTERPDAGYKRRYPAAVYDNVILIWGFQSKVRPKDIKDCICKVFGRASVTSVFPIDSTAVLVQFSKQESVNDFLDLKATLESADSAISVLHPLSTILEGGKTRAAKYDTYRDICRSSVSKFSFADQAEAVCSTSNSESKFKECNAADGSGAYGSALDGTVPASVQQSGGAKSGSKNKGDDDFSYQDILDALQDGKTSVGKRMSNA
uniref:indole-3-glycerol-phosphate synthase n=3 Tax=Oryza TaxID=4527 RepID=A0A0E0PAB0_ORYRU